MYPEDKERARRLGVGNISNGVRLALRSEHPTDPHRERQQHGICADVLDLIREHGIQEDNVTRWYDRGGTRYMFDDATNRHEAGWFHAEGDEPFDEAVGVWVNPRLKAVLCWKGLEWRLAEFEDGEKYQEARDTATHWISGYSHEVKCEFAGQSSRNARVPVIHYMPNGKTSTCGSIQKGDGKSDVLFGVTCPRCLAPKLQEGGDI